MFSQKSISNQNVMKINQTNKNHQLEPNFSYEKGEWIEK
jgi:hypothetical protein